jgi:hypothetical protein
VHGFTILGDFEIEWTCFVLGSGHIDYFVMSKQ